MTRLEDRALIQDVLFRYARAVDRLDYEGIRECYFPDAVDNHGGYIGTVDGLVEDIRRRHQSIDSSQHYITNVLIDFTGEDTAQVESYCLCYLRQQAADSSREHELAVIRCRYIDRFERREGRWAIADRVVVFDESQLLTVTDRLDPAWVASRRNASDPVHAWVPAHTR
jgi:3-phenylpropionate/cinnamic acid dioxygenase small subunit